MQTLDGVGAGIFGAIFPIIVADLMRGTGRSNAAQGVILTAQGIGAALSTMLAGIVVVHAGYSAAFLTLAGGAALGGARLLRGDAGYAAAVVRQSCQAGPERRNDSLRGRDEPTA